MVEFRFEFRYVQLSKYYSKIVYGYSWMFSLENRSRWRVRPMILASDPDPSSVSNTATNIIIIAFTIISLNRLYSTHPSLILYNYIKKIILNSQFISNPTKISLWRHTNFYLENFINVSNMLFQPLSCWWRP